MSAGRMGFEWKSSAQILGLPLIHITFGRDPKTGKPLVSRGIIAIGQIGVGLITIAQVGVGILFGLGQLMAGYFEIAQIAVGHVIICQVGLGKYVLAQVGFGTHVCSMKACDPVAREYFLKLWQEIVKMGVRSWS